MQQKIKQEFKEKIQQLLQKPLMIKKELI